MTDFNFKLHPNKSADQQMALLNSILDSQNLILDKISALDNRISNIEQTPCNHSFQCSASDLRTLINQKTNDISKTISHISTGLKTDSNPDFDSIQQLNGKISNALTQLKYHTSSLVFGATFFISCWLAAFIWWLWDVPAQTQAVNNYAYQQTHK